MIFQHLWLGHKFARVARRMRNYPRGRSSERSGWDVTADLTSGGSSNLFLGVYGDVAIMDLLRAFGLLDALARQGIDRPILDLDLSDPHKHILRMYQQEIGEDSLVTEFVVRYTSFSPVQKPAPAEAQEQHPCLYLEWLLLQNPTRSFDAEHAAMPDQEYPPLALGDMALSLMARMARYIGVSGIVTVPANLHAALYFATRYQALTQRVQVALAALDQAASHFGRLEIAWAERWGDLLESRTGHPYRWTPETLVLPLTGALNSAVKLARRRDSTTPEPKLSFTIRQGVRLLRRPNGTVAREYVDGGN